MFYFDPPWLKKPLTPGSYPTIAVIMAVAVGLVVPHANAQTAPEGTAQPPTGTSTAPAAPPTPATPPAQGTPPSPGTTTPPTAATPPAPAAPAHWYDRIAVSGSIDTYYDYNTNSPDLRPIPATATTPGTPSSVGLNQLQNWTFGHNNFSVPLAELVLAENPDAATSPIGFKLVLAYGNATDWVHGFYSSENSYKNILQAYATYIAFGKSKAPVTFTAGKFVTWIGQEVIESQNNYNYTHGLLFAWAIPYYHTGVSISRPFGKKVTLTGYLLNGWNNVVDNNNGKTVGISANVAVTPKLTFIINGIAGPETTGDEGHWRVLNDDIITYAVTPKLNLVLNYDYGHDHPGAGAPNVQWQGAAGYVHYAFNDKSAGTLRAEIFSDPQGFAASAAPPFAPGGLAGTVIAPPSGGQELKEATLTYEYKFHPRVITRLEVREDWSTQNVFAKGNSTTKNQTQFVIGNIINF